MEHILNKEDARKLYEFFSVIHFTLFEIRMRLSALHEHLSMSVCITRGGEGGVKRGKSSGGGYECGMRREEETDEEKELHTSSNNNTLNTERTCRGKFISLCYGH